MKRLEFPSVPKTEEAGRNFAAVLDRMIDEAAAQLRNLQELRRNTAETFGIDRRDDIGPFAAMADSANRAEYEGEGDTVDGNGRMVPRGRPEMPPAPSDWDARKPKAAAR